MREGHKVKEKPLRGERLKKTQQKHKGKYIMWMRQKLSDFMREEGWRRLGTENECRLSCVSGQERTPKKGERGWGGREVVFFKPAPLLKRRKCSQLKKSKKKKGNYDQAVGLSEMEGKKKRFLLAEH